MSASARYVAIITDGNGRWAQQRGLPVVEGHRAGADVVKARLRDAVELGIEELTVFSFSTENWARPAEEVEGLMRMFGERIDAETPELRRGRRADALHRPPRGRRPELVARMEWAEAETAGERADHALRRLQLRRQGGDRRRRARSFEGGSEEDFRKRLYAPEMHDPDLLIRTSGEQRISNYLLWQCAYSELVFRDELWPDFDRDALEDSLAEFEDAQAALRREGLMVEDLFDEEMFEPEPARRARPPREPRRRRRNPLGGETAERVLVAIPWIAFAIAITVARRRASSPWRWSALGLLALREYFLMTAELRPLQPRRLHRRRRR